jgi:hypothetical protein
MMLIFYVYAARNILPSSALPNTLKRVDHDGKVQLVATWLLMFGLLFSHVGTAISEH